MPQLAHTYGPTCRLAPAVTFSGSKGDDDMPALKAQFFYASPLPIDDPLSTAPTPTSSDSKSIKHTPRPFSAYDNSALEEAWLSLGSGKDKKRSKSVSPSKEDRRRGRKKTDKPQGHNSGPESPPESCACKGSHPSCRNGRDKCKCTSCPQNSAFAGASSDAQIPPDAVSKSKDSKGTKSSKKGQPSSQAKESSTPKTSRAQQSDFTDAKDSKRSKKETSSNYVNENGSANAPQGQELNKQSSPRIPTCDGPRHSATDSEKPACCGDLEDDDQVDHINCITVTEDDQNSEESDQDQGPKGSKRGNAKSKGKRKAGFDGVEGAQGDGADDESSITECSNKVDSKEYVTSENREHSEQQIECPELQSDEYRTRTETETEKLTQSQAVVSEGNGKKASRKSAKATKATMAETDANISKTKSWKRKDNSELSPQSSDVMTGGVPVQGGDAGTTGLPFVKLPSGANSPQPSEHDGSELKSANQGRRNADRSSRRSNERESSETETVQVHGCKAHRNSTDQVDVPVGVSRLHLVQLPALQMKPIYWSPVHDICAVTRGTWFYKDTMYPVEPSVANQLEAGYRELRPWSQTWNDELNSAIEVGPAGEEKIAHRLWPKDEEQKSVPHKGKEHHPLSDDPYCAALCFHGEAAAEGAIDPDNLDKKASEPSAIVKRYSKSQVIYKDAHNAFILKTNLQPSAYYGRKPLQKIRKGNTVGIHVVRGFDWKAWEKLHPSKKTAVSKKAEENAPISGDAHARKRNACAACTAQEERCKVTDLIFVIHGIGQKLSESMESFHFTHAINAFRRSVNVELGNEAVQRVLRKDLGGVMVLPINWRSRVSFDDGSPAKDGDKSGHGPDFSMKDITPKTIPAVRDFIEKVMLDIPYWMSIHKPKMIQAVISEANRVYRLWCKNNPEFHKEGRIHIIAHSLGSAMALDILSNQPTSLPKLNPNSKKMNTKCFDFQTTNLFFCGSPAGFFLYLEKGCLIPRRDQNKAGAEHADEQDKAIVGDVGTFGCLAVDNVYNIIHPEDPISYQVNATVDPQYAVSLKRAQVPSATTGFFESIGNAMRSRAPGASPATDLAAGQVSKPAGINRLPSQLEMEVHDFTREEIAEKKFGLLNDNGQIDYFLCSDSGPLSFQYINMLSAHSSYWENSDFIRLVVIEVGRRPGSSHCLPSMKAAKLGHKAQKGN
jgi:DDHD domain